MAEQVTEYRHSLGVEFRQTDSLLVWKGESIWDSDDVDIMPDAPYALQLIFSSLPSATATRPSVPELRSDAVLSYYNINCFNRWFSCPALPYRLSIEKHDGFFPSASHLPAAIHQPEALAAYVDLMQTAENALPEGTEADWRDPLRASLWTSTTLMGQYVLGPKSRPINAVVQLEGRSEGYYVTSCGLISDADYAALVSRQASWRAALHSFYDFFQH